MKYKSTFDRNNNLEDILNKINKLLEPTESDNLKKISNYPIPTIFLIGTPRSGSTLLLQWLASQKVFCYPSNFLSRFYKAPYIGSLIHEMLTNPIYNYADEFYDIKIDINKESITGKTKGLNSPHEFWYFWRKHFQFKDIPDSNQEFLKTANFDSFNKELVLIQSVYQKPFVFKAHIINSYLKVASKYLKNAIFLHHSRNPIANIRSLIQARILRNDSRDIWYSFKPREYDLIKDLDIYHQVAGQVYFIEKGIRDNIKILGNRYLHVSYEELCLNPSMVYSKIINIANKFNKDDKITRKYSGEKSFEISNPENKFDDNKIKNAYNYFITKYGQI